MKEKEIKLHDSKIGLVRLYSLQDKKNNLFTYVVEIYDNDEDVTIVQKEFDDKITALYTYNRVVETVSTLDLLLT